VLYYKSVFTLLYLLLTNVSAAVASVGLAQW